MELQSIEGDDKALKLLQYTGKELSAILGDPLNNIGTGGFSSVYRG